MIIEKIEVNLGRRFHQNDREHNLDISLQVSLEPDENSESVYYSLKNTLEGQLDAWEHQIKHSNQEPLLTVPEVTYTIPAPPFVTASEIKPKLQKSRNFTQTPAQEKQLLEEGEINQGVYVCPTCGEQMFPKDGKDYYLCTKHWAYPDMIKKGLVKERKF
jgi:NADH pyrophosphatase NudC (nudix superfamily)